MKQAVLIVAALLLTLPSAGDAELLFHDDFEDGVTADWGNELGEWGASGGVYEAADPSTNPPAYTSVVVLPELVNFTVELDINGVNDGGVFLRSHRCDNGQVDGVLFLVGGYSGSYNGVYWHTWTCSGHGSVHQATPIPGLQGSDAHIRIEVVGDTYSAFVNGSSDPVSVLTTPAYASGRVALYQYLGQSFDNVAIYDANLSSATDRTWSSIKALYR